MGCSNDKLIKVKAIQNSELEKSKILPIKPNSEKEPKIKRNIDTKERLDLMTAEDISKVDINDKKKDEIGEIDIIKKDKNKKDINLNIKEKNPSKEEKIKENQIEENNILIIEEVDENNVIIEEREEKNEKIQNIKENFEKYSENENNGHKKAGRIKNLPDFIMPWNNQLLVISVPKYLFEISARVPSSRRSEIAWLIASLKESLSSPFARGIAYIVTSSSIAATLSSVVPVVLK